MNSKKGNLSDQGGEPPSQSDSFQQLCHYSCQGTAVLWQQSQLGVKRTGERELAYREHKRLFSRWDAALDNPSNGPHWLLEPAVAEILVESLHFRDGEVYDRGNY
jgi:hypothetical protein